MAKDDWSKGKTKASLQDLCERWVQPEMQVAGLSSLFACFETSIRSYLISGHFVESRKKLRKEAASLTCWLSAGSNRQTPAQTPPAKLAPPWRMQQS